MDFAVHIYVDVEMAANQVPRLREQRLTVALGDLSRQRKGHNEASKEHDLPLV